MEKDRIEEMLKLLKLSMIRANMFKELKSLTYDPDKETVIATFYATSVHDDSLTYVKHINVACDSNGAMIYDVVRVLYDFCR